MIWYRFLDISLNILGSNFPLVNIFVIVPGNTQKNFRKKFHVHQSRFWADPNMSWNVYILHFRSLGTKATSKWSKNRIKWFFLNSKAEITRFEIPSEYIKNDTDGHGFEYTIMHTQANFVLLPNSLTQIVKKMLLQISYRRPLTLKTRLRLLDKLQCLHWSNWSPRQS